MLPRRLSLQSWLIKLVPDLSYITLVLLRAWRPDILCQNFIFAFKQAAGLDGLFGSSQSLVCNFFASSELLSYNIFSAFPHFSKIVTLETHSQKIMMIKFSGLPFVTRRLWVSKWGGTWMIKWHDQKLQNKILPQWNICTQNLLTESKHIIVKGLMTRTPDGSWTGDLYCNFSPLHTLSPQPYMLFMCLYLLHN